jgi:hypothetical protein
MPLDIIGVGFGRTGTLSIRKALGDLGYPCYHMFDVLFNPTRKADVDFWQAVAENPDGDHDWDWMFRDHSATVDFPACAVWRQLAEAYPKTKILLTLHARGAEAWYDSTVSTIYVGTGLEAGTPFSQKINDMMDRLVWHGLLKGTMDDRDKGIARYAEHIQDVIAAIPAERLLIYSADQGWEPLCRMLDRPVPQEPFPNVNNREEMARILDRLAAFGRFGLGRAAG